MVLYSVVLKLRRSDAGIQALPNGYQVYALLLALLRSVDSRLAERLHADGGPKPFTISLLPGGPERRGAPTASPDGHGCWLRFTFLEDAPLAALVEAVFRLDPEARLELGGASYRCEALTTTPSQSPWARHAAFEELLDGASESLVVSLRFASPTTFRSGGRRNVLFPDPSLVFGSLLARWNAFAPAPLAAAGGSELFSHMQPVHYQLRTAAISFGTYEELGFQGVCTCALDAGMRPEERRAVNALADFAFYSGVGAKTTMGMGQCRRVKHASPVPGGAGSDAEKAG